MAKYKVTYYESFYSIHEIEADSPEEAEAKFWEQWENEDDFVDEVIYAREVTDSEVTVD